MKKFYSFFLSTFGLFLVIHYFRFGENRNPEPEPVSWFSLFFEAFEDIPVRILTVAAIIALGLFARPFIIF